VKFIYIGETLDRLKNQKIGDWKKWRKEKNRPEAAFAKQLKLN